jgi:hypothetical protein
VFSTLLHDRIGHGAASSIVRPPYSRNAAATTLPYGQSYFRGSPAGAGYSTVAASVHPGSAKGGTSPVS